MSTDIDDAARRVAITLMRLNEALEMADTKHYSPIPTKHGWSPRWHRQVTLKFYYRDWFRRQARETE